MTKTRTRTSVLLAETFTRLVSHTSTITRTVTPDSASPTQDGFSRERIIISISVEAPLTCENYWAYTGDFMSTSPRANPDIAGLGILLASFVTACAVVLLSIVAYIGGFLPRHHLRRVDRRIFRANSRNQNSRWREIIEKVMMSFSDQQLVTGLAILVAGYYEMANNNLSVYHWQIVVYLAWLSSAVHIASLTLLRDVFNKTPTLRNIRVALMLVLLMLLIVAMWPTRFAVLLDMDDMGMPLRCWWRPPRMQGSQSVDLSYVDPNWVLSMVMPLFAYIWKLSQLFASSRGFVRRWLVAKPEAAIERLLRRAAVSWRLWPRRLLTGFYLHFVVFAESAESFAATIVYLCLALPYGIALIAGTRSSMPNEVTAGEQRLTFGQLVPLFLLILPILQVLELRLESDKKTQEPGAIYSLMANELPRNRRVDYPNLTSALCVNEPSDSKEKMPDDSGRSRDPIVDHLMGSLFFKCVVWLFFATLVGIGATVVGMNIVSAGSGLGSDTRAVVLLPGAIVIVIIVPVITMFVLPCSARLK